MESLHSHQRQQVLEVTTPTKLPPLGVPEKEQKQTKTSGHFHDLIIFISTNVLMIRDSVRFFLLVETILVETNIFWWKLILFGGN
jgi:hypothetical protein